MKGKIYEKGITLIALVITILLLLILAGVTLSIVFNGEIINKSQTAVDKYKEESTKEDVKLSILEHKLDEKYSTNEIIKNLQDMNSLKINGIGYKQIYSKSEVTTDLNDKFKLNIDQNFISLQNMKKILKESKN